MKRIVKISMIAAGALIVVGSFTACSHFKSPENRAQWVVEKVTDKLELTEVQQGKLKTLKVEMMATRKDMKQNFADTRGQFKSLFDESTLDQKQALSLVHSHTQFIDQRAPVIVAAFGDFYDSLDAKQQIDVREFVNAHDDHHGSHRFFGHH